MAVETLSIIGGPLAGLAMNLAMNGGMSGIQTWMVGHGIRPSHVVIGAIIGALVRGDILGGAIRGALVVGGVEAGYYYLAR
jgi:hypothetical protein